MPGFAGILFVFAVIWRWVRHITLAAIKLVKQLQKIQQNTKNKKAEKKRWVRRRTADMGNCRRGTSTENAFDGGVLDGGVQRPRGKQDAPFGWLDEKFITL